MKKSTGVLTSKLFYGWTLFLIPERAIAFGCLYSISFRCSCSNVKHSYDIVIYFRKLLIFPWLTSNLRYRHLGSTTGLRVHLQGCQFVFSFVNDEIEVYGRWSGLVVEFCVYTRTLRHFSRWTIFWSNNLSPIHTSLQCFFDLIEISRTLTSRSASTHWMGLLFLCNVESFTGAVINWKCVFYSRRRFSNDGPLSFNRRNA